MNSRPRFRVLAVLPAVALALATAGCVQSTSTGNGDTGSVQLIQPGKLLTCSHLPYVPFQYTDNGKVVGFDVDLVDLVGKKLNAPQQVIDTAWDGIQSGTDLNSNQCDVIAGAISITPVRAKNFDYSDPYFHATQALLTKKGAGYKSLDALKGKKVGVQGGTTGENFVKDYNAKNGNAVSAVNFEDSALLETAVKTGQVDASINDNGLLYDYAKKNPDTEVSAEFETNDVYGLGVRKGNTALRQAINEALKQSAQDGSYAQIYQKWFAKQPTWLPGQPVPTTTATSKG